MKTLKPLIFFGTEEFSAPTLKALLNSNWPIKAVVTKPDTKRGRGRIMASPIVAEIARKNNIPILQPSRLKDIEEEIKGFEAEFAVLVSYGKIIPASIIKLFPLGILNIHPSLLPKYRGPSPIESAILNGDRETGISIMKLTADMDSGPVYVQGKVSLDGSETKLELYSRLSSLGAGLMQQYLDKIISEELLPFPQDESKATYCLLLTKDDGNISWAESAVVIERKVRAFLGYPKTRTKIKGKDVVITKSRIANNSNDGDLVIKCSEGYLEILELIAPSGKKISGADFIRGYAAG